jgi:hypothetical protein
VLESREVVAQSWSWRVCLCIIVVSVTLDVLVVQSPLVWIGVAGMLAIAAQFWGQLRGLAVVTFTCGLFSYSPFETGVLSRLYPGDIAIAIFLIVWLARERPWSFPRLFQPNLVNAPLFGMAIIVPISMLWSRLHPDPSVTYSFPHSDVSWTTTQGAQLTLLGATICIPFAVAAAIKTRRDIEYIVIVMGIVAALGTLVTVAAMMYGFGGSFEILGTTRAYWDQPWQSSIRLTELILPFLYSGVIFGRRSLSSYSTMCILFVLCLVGVVLTFSRQSWLVAAFGMFCVSVLWLPRWTVIPTTLVIISLILLLVWAPGAVSSVTQFYNPNEVYGLDRLYFYITGLHLFLTHPFLGVGAGNYQFFDRSYADVSAGGISHNEFITVAAETGIPGLFVLFWFVVALLKIPRTFNLRAGDRNDPLYWAKVAGFVFLIAWIAECFFQEAFFVTAAAGGGTKVMTATVFPWILLGLLFAVFRLNQSLPETS